MLLSCWRFFTHTIASTCCCASNSSNRACLNAFASLSAISAVTLSLGCPSLPKRCSRILVKRVFLRLGIVLGCNATPLLKANIQSLLYSLSPPPNPEDSKSVHVRCQTNITRSHTETKRSIFRVLAPINPYGLFFHASMAFECLSPTIHNKLAVFQQKHLPFAGKHVQP